MTPDEAPVGSVIVLGDPANGRTATRQTSGKWTLNRSTHQEVDFDELHKTATLVYNPEDDADHADAMGEIKRLLRIGDTPIYRVAEEDGKFFREHPLTEIVQSTPDGHKILARIVKWMTDEGF